MKNLFVTWNQFWLKQFFLASFRDTKLDTCWLILFDVRSWSRRTVVPFKVHWIDNANIFFSVKYGITHKSKFSLEFKPIKYFVQPLIYVDQTNCLTYITMDCDCLHSGGSRPQLVISERTVNIFRLCQSVFSPYSFGQTCVASFQHW